MAIRRAAPDDFARLTPLMVQYNALEGIPWRPQPVKGAFERLCREPSLGFVLVAEAPPADHAALLGYMVVTYSYDLEFAGRDGFVTELYVEEGSRRHGLASELLEFAEREARRHDASALHLLVSPDNTRAQELYRRAGFQTSRRVAMTKRLVAEE